MKSPRLKAVAQHLCGLAEGLCLAGLAGSIFSLYTRKTLWYFINPKYQTLVLATAVAMAALGVFAALSPPRPARFSRPLIFALLLALCQFGGADSLFSSPKPGTGVLSEPETAVEEAPPSRAQWDGREFIRINVGELYDISSAKHPDKQAQSKSYLVQGFILRGKHATVIYRTALWCCFADATAVAFRIRADKDDLPEDGKWVQVYGHLEKAKPGKPPKVDLDPGFSSVNPDFVFVVEHYEDATAPTPPYMFEWHDKEPYAF
jgi:uncharacterized repeat protein (TIGR03943 family)